MRVGRLTQHVHEGEALVLLLVVSRSGRLLHPYRREWSKERNHLPVGDVMAAGGGWQAIRTFTESHNGPDLDTMLAVMEAPAKARAEAAAKARSEAANSQSKALGRTAGGSASVGSSSMASAHAGIRRRPANPVMVDQAGERDQARPAHLRLV